MAQRKLTPRNTLKFFFLNYLHPLTRKGKQNLAEKIWLQVLRNIRKTKKERAHIFIYKTLLKVMPLLDERKIKRGKETYRIPSPLRWKRSRAQILKWLINELNQAKARGKPAEFLAKTFLELSKNKGTLLEKVRNWDGNLSKNISYLRYRWF